LRQQPFPAPSITIMAIPTETQRKLNNASRLLKISPSIRGHVAAVITELEAAGYRPQIDSQVWRSIAQQAKLKAEGKSTVSYSFHNVSTSMGSPDALAADIVDVRWQWNAPRSYWLRLAGAAQRQGLTTGIYWGLTQAQRKAIATAIEREDWDAKVALGWDTAHVEVPDFSITRARNGERPQLGKPVLPQPMRLFVNGKQVENAYLVAGKWYCSEGALAAVLGGATQNEAAIAPVAQLFERWGWVNVKYTLQAEKNRADVRVIAR